MEVKPVARMPGTVQEILRRLEGAGHEAWCVGGAVRDLLLGREPGDWDVTTSAVPEVVLALFAPRALPTGLQHGTVTVDHVEITTYRRDGTYSDCRRPDRVEFTGSLEEDLSRRDFTVNAMALDLRGTLLDPFGGQADLENRVLRAVGDPERRFQEDALRILRGLRFAACLGLAPEPGTAQSLMQNRLLLKEIAPERIGAELMKLLCGPHAPAVLREYAPVMGVFWPEVLPMVGFDQRNVHHCYDVWEHSLRALEAVPGDPVLRCAALLHDIGKPSAFTLDGRGVGHFYGHAAISCELAEGMLRRLRVSTGFRERVVRLVEWHDREIPRTDRGLRRALRLLGEEDLRLLLCLKRADNLAQAPAYRGRQTEIDRAEQILDRLLAEDACFSLRQLAVRGDDLLALGLRGPAVGKALDMLLNRVIDGELPNERAALLEFVTKP